MESNSLLKQMDSELFACNMLLKVAGVITLLLSFSIASLAQSYCESNGGDGYPIIESITVGSIDNYSASDEGYCDYTSLVLEAQAGDQYDITFNPGGPWWIQYRWSTWIDFNQDGDFDDDGELVVQRKGYFNEYDVITIPEDALPGSTVMRISMDAYSYQEPCAMFDNGEVEDYTVNISGGCEASAGTLTAEPFNACFEGSASISAVANGDAVVPEGYSSVYVLTQGEGLTIVNAGAEPSFDITEPGLYTIHTLVYDPATLDLGIVEIGVTTGVDVYGLIVPGGGAICADLDVAGAQFMVSTPDAGTLTAVESETCLTSGVAAVSATPNGDINVPSGYSSVFVLTQGEGLTIVNAGGEPSFEVSEAGLYTIHTLVYDPSTLDLGIVELGVTTGVDVFGLIVPGGGDICAALDVAGAPVNVVECPCTADAGTLTADMDEVCLNGETEISATTNGDMVVPSGYEVLYVLTAGEELVIYNVSATPSFTVDQGGLYTIHTLVYDPASLDLGIVEIGVTTGVDVYGLIVPGGGEICAALDVAGAPIFVDGPQAGTIAADEFINCYGENPASLVGIPQGDMVVPEGYETLYVLTSAWNLTILNVSATPEFDVDYIGLYRIHTLVYDPMTLDLGIVELGSTTGFDVNGLLVQGGGSVCASLDVPGALFVAIPDYFCESFFNLYNSEIADGTIEEKFSSPEATERIFREMAEPIMNVNAYPNPAQDELMLDVQVQSQSIVEFAIVDLAGRVLMERQQNTCEKGVNTLRIDINELETGNYVLLVFSNDGQQTLPFVKVN